MKHSSRKSTRRKSRRKHGYLAALSSLGCLLLVTSASTTCCQAANDAPFLHLPATTRKNEGIVVGALTPSPTDSPTAFPTMSPTESPTLPPTTSPTDSPTASPTTSPTASPTNSPTFLPTLDPTSSPTSFPTPSPTTSPTTSPTASPTSTNSPTPSPTLPPTMSPTFAKVTFPPSPPTHITPIQSPTIIKDNLRMRNIVVTLSDVQPLSEQDKIWFQDQTKEYIEYYYNDDLRRQLQHMLEKEDGVHGGGRDRRNLEYQANLFDVTTFIDVTNMDPPFFNERKTRNLRQTQEESPTLTITYDQVISFKTDDQSFATSVPLEDIVIEPLDNIFKRTNYVNTYLKGGDGVDSPVAFKSLRVVTLPEIRIGEDNQVSIALIVGASGGGVALAIVVGILCWMKKGEKEGSNKRGAPRSDTFNGSTSVPTSQVNLNLSGGDEVSTLMVDPPQQLGVYTNQSSLNGFNRDEPSIGTFDPDPDYHGVYGGADNSIVSSVGATLSSQTQKSRLSNVNGMGVLGSGTVYTADDQSFEQYFRNQQTESSPPREEEILEVFAPAGKLGVVIDTPNNGVPVVFNIKESCPIKDQLQVGDRLIAVDDEDVRNMTAVMVSKLISQKSSNETRKFTVGRTVTLGANGTNFA